MKYMKNVCLLLLLFSHALVAQISNPGFETSRDTTPSLPASWAGRLAKNYSWCLDSTTQHSGNYSLFLSNEQNTDSNVFSPFSQIVSISAETLKKINLTVFIKTMNVSRDVGLWCQLWDEKNKTIGFTSLQTLHIQTSGSRGWTKFSVPLTIGPEVRKLLIGGFLKGTGHVWYDDFAIEDVSSNKAVSKKASAFIREVISIAEKNSIVKDSVNWEKIRSNMLSLSGGAQNTRDCYPAVNYLIRELNAKGDNHSGFYPPEFNIKNKTENTDGRQPESKYLGNSIAYISVPGFTSINQKLSEAFASKIQLLIKTLDSSYTITKWIVDLRENTGGNMYPMIAGLGSILGDDTLGYFYLPTLKEKHPWYYSEGRSGSDGTTLCEVKHPYNIRQKNPRIIVLSGPNTASSGEMTLISFKGKVNTTVVGSPSAGYSTGNAGHLLSDGSVLNLCTSFCYDRNQTLYSGPIPPDVSIPQPGSDKADTVLEYVVKLVSE
jgi:hypothetical protein